MRRRVVAAEDFKKLLGRHGLNLIAERVEDEKTVVQLLEYGVDFAQGYLFGEPRAVRDEVLKETPAAEKAVRAAPLFRLKRSQPRLCIDRGGRRRVDRSAHERYSNHFRPFATSRAITMR